MKSLEQVHTLDYDVIQVQHKNGNLCNKNHDNKSEMSKSY